MHATIDATSLKTRGDPGSWSMTRYCKSQSREKGRYNASLALVLLRSRDRAFVDFHRRTRFGYARSTTFLRVSPCQPAERSKFEQAAGSWFYISTERNIVQYSYDWTRTQRAPATKQLDSVQVMQITLITRYVSDAVGKIAFTCLLARKYNVTLNTQLEWITHFRPLGRK